MVLDCPIKERRKDERWIKDETKNVMVKFEREERHGVYFPIRRSF